MNPTRAEIDLNKLEYNFNRIKKHLQKNNPSRKRIKICGVVKANAYGHGIQEISKKLISIGADYLGVANYDEAIKLRTTIPDASILVFGTLIHSKFKPATYVKRLLKNDLIATVASLETARFLDYFSKRLGKKFKVHIKVDTGMKRIGFDVKGAFKNISQVFTYKNLDIEGIYTHFATAESDIPFAKQQLTKFKELLHLLKKAGMEFPIIHTANSGAVLDIKESYFDMVRPGLILYGYYPSDSNIKKIPLKPIMNLKSKVTYIKRVEPNTSISYGRDYYTDERSFIGSIPIGYGDGYWRALSNRAKVLINGKFYPIVGNITMDWLMVNLGERSNVRVGDDVLLMGSENDYNIGADKLARMTKTIPYEICCAVADRVQRIYINGK
ncbi:MAG: alanine racemase [Ignavibacteriae bacterium]|nr:alanine racemase [Ignavibacteriota bacterium]